MVAPCLARPDKEGYIWIRVINPAQKRVRISQLTPLARFIVDPKISDADLEFTLRYLTFYFPDGPPSVASVLKRHPEARLDRSTARPSSTRSVAAWVNFVPWPSWVTVRPRPEQTGCHCAHGANLVPVPALGEQMTADAHEKSHSMFDIGEKVDASEPSFTVVDTRSC